MGRASRKPSSSQKSISPSDRFLGRGTTKFYLGDALTKSGDQVQIYGKKLDRPKKFPFKNRGLVLY